MSCYEWESGTITLPTEAVPVVKEALRKVLNDRHDQAYLATKKVWQQLKSYSPDKFRKNLSEYQHKRWDSESHGLYSSRTTIEDDEQFFYIFEQLIGWDNTGKPHQPTHEDVDKQFPRATNRTTRFPVGWEADITFDGRKVTWTVGENNHACERAHGHPVAEVFFAQLARVRWTRGSGGVIVGNNEYNRDNRGAGGGGNFVVQEFGPQKPRKSSNRTPVGYGARW